MVVKKLDKKPKLTYTRTQDETETRVTFTVSLGLMPDYLYDGKGLKIDGVRDGKPAQTGGLQKGDIITKMGDTDVPDIQAYMKTLSTLKAGQQITVTILRNGQEIQKPITL
jgi:S1-C subfamily serine protease